MKIIKSEVNYVPQQQGVVGMLKLVEKAGRVAYKSESRITEDSYIKFVRMLYNRGHHAVFNLGTVYLKIDFFNCELEDWKRLAKMSRKSLGYTKSIFREGCRYITTNYRVICQHKLQDLMEKYWSDPTEDSHYHRVTSHWVCSRVISQEVLRHRLFSPTMESTRFVNYSKDANGGEIQFILPQWIYELREMVANSVDPQTLESRSWILDYDGQELWNHLACIDRTVAGRDSLYKAMEDQYLFELSTDESFKLPPEDARGSLGLDMKTEFYFTGYVEDWFYENTDPSSPEKAGFFYLRSARDAHPDVRILSDSLRETFIKFGINNWK